MDDILWPLRGVLLFLRHPSWWLRPMLGMLFGLLIFLGIGFSVGWFFWPSAELIGWSFWWRVAVAIGVGGAALVMSWVLFLPIILSLLLEDLARTVLRHSATLTLPHLGLHHATAEKLAQLAANVVQPNELPFVPGLLASLRVVSGTLGPRFGWMGAAFISGIMVPPSSVVVSALGMSHIACIDACDIAMSLRGFTGEQRLRTLAAHRKEIRQAALAAGIMNLGLGATVIGWLVWLPGIVVGAVLRTRAWEEFALKTPTPTNAEPAAPAALADKAEKTA
jgi:hypothetical protein